MRWSQNRGPTPYGKELWELPTNHLERIEAMLEQRVKDLGLDAQMLGPRTDIHEVKGKYGQLVKQVPVHTPPTPDYERFRQRHQRAMFELLMIRRELSYRASSEYNAFRKAIISDPREMTHKLVFADWLAEKAPDIYGRSMAVLERKMRLWAEDGLIRPCRRRDPKRNIRPRRAYR